MIRNIISVFVNYFLEDRALGWTSVARMFLPAPCHQPDVYPFLVMPPCKLAAGSAGGICFGPPASGLLAGGLAGDHKNGRIRMADRKTDMYFSRAFSVRTAAPKRLLCKAFHVFGDAGVLKTGVLKRWQLSPSLTTGRLGTGCQLLGAA